VIGLALLGTVVWTTVADSIRTQVAHAVAVAAKAGRPLPKPGTPPPASIYDHALTVGFSRGFLVAAGIGLLALLIGIVTIRSAARNWPVPCPSPKRRHRSPRHRSPGPCSGMRTEPPSPRQPVLAGSASRHVITTWEKRTAPGSLTEPRPSRGSAAVGFGEGTGQAKGCGHSSGAGPVLVTRIGAPSCQPSPV
jgi:hypothetical protein